MPDTGLRAVLSRAAWCCVTEEKYRTGPKLHTSAQVLQ